MMVVTCTKSGEKYNQREKKINVHLTKRNQHFCTYLEDTVLKMPVYATDETNC